MIIMYKINSKYSINETAKKLDQALIKYNIYSLSMIGFIGKVDLEKGRLWIANHSNVYRSRNGHRYKTYRRFEGEFCKSIKGVTIEGAFKVRPLFKITERIYFLLILAISLVGFIASNNLIASFKLLGVSVLMIIVGLGVIKFKLSSTRLSEIEIIEFIEDVVGKIK